MVEIKKIGVLTGGGDCSGLNAVLRAVVLTAINKYGCQVVGFKKGYAGLYANDSMKLTVDNCKDILDWGGTILKNSNKDNLFNYLLAIIGKLTHKSARIGADKARIFYLVSYCVFLGILYGIGIDFNSAHLPCMG